jgi:hypothetical protein
MSNHNGDNYENIQQFDEVVSTQQQWPSATPKYFIPIISVPTPIAIFDGLQSSQLGPNMDLVPINLEMEQIHLINELKQLHCID